MAAQFATYRTSGRFSPLALPLFAGATAAGIAVAWLYQALMSWIPYIYIDLVLCAGFAAVLGVGGMLAVRYGRCRNLILGAVLALPLALVPLGASYYWGYRSTLATVAEQHPEAPIDVIKQELTFSRWLEIKQEAGWTLSSHSSSSSAKSPDISGVGVLVVWAIEALVFLGIVLLLTHAEASKPYCERCGRWCTSKPLTLQGLTREDAERAMQMGDLASVIDIKMRSDGDAARALVLTADVCEGCSDTGFLTIDEKTTTQRKKQTSTSTKKLLINAVLTPEQRAAFVHRYNLAVGQKLAA